jgi:hypothetical protein
MSGAFGLTSTMSKHFVSLGQSSRTVFEAAVPCAPTVLVEPARHALWVGSSYWSTRNRHPPTGHTPLNAVDNCNDPDISRSAFRPLCNRGLDAVEKFNVLNSSNRAFWLPGIGDSGCASFIFARQPQGVTADFWYPSMRRATPATATQRRPTEVNKLGQRHRSRAFENGVTPGWWNP